jgi:hypothetical protein
MVHTRTRRGISTFIAVLLMMVLAVSAGVVIYAYTMGYLGGLGSGETPGALSVDTSSGSTSQITVWVRNIGSKSVTMDKAYVGGTPQDMGTGNTTTAISEGAVKKIVVSGTFTSGVTYQVKLVAKDNTQLSFSVKIS